MTEDEVVNLIRYPHESMTVEQCLQVIAFIRSQGRKLAEFQQWWERLEHAPSTCEHSFTLHYHPPSLFGEIFGQSAHQTIGICSKCGVQS